MRERLETAAEPALRLPHALRDGADAPPVTACRGAGSGRPHRAGRSGGLPLRSSLIEPRPQCMSRHGRSGTWPHVENRGIASPFTGVYAPGAPDSHLHDRLVRLLHPREVTARRPRARLRRGGARCRSELPPTCLRPRSPVDGAARDDRRRADRRLPGARGTRPRRSAGRTPRASDDVHTKSRRLSTRRDDARLQRLTRFRPPAADSEGRTSSPASDDDANESRPQRSHGSPPRPYARNSSCIDPYAPSGSA